VANTHNKEMVRHIHRFLQPYNDYETVCFGHMLEALCPLCPVENLLLL